MKIDPTNSNKVSWFVEVQGAKLEETHPRLILSTGDMSLLFKGTYMPTEQGSKVIFDIPPVYKWLGESTCEGRVEVLVGDTQCLPVWSDKVILERVVRARVKDAPVVESVAIAEDPAPPKETPIPTVSVKAVSLQVESHVPPVEEEPIPAVTKSKVVPVEKKKLQVEDLVEAHKNGTLRKLLESE